MWFSDHQHHLVCTYRVGKSCATLANKTITKKYCGFRSLTSFGVFTRLRIGLVVFLNVFFIVFKINLTVTLIISPFDRIRKRQRTFVLSISLILLVTIMVFVFYVVVTMVFRSSLLLWALSRMCIYRVICNRVISLCGRDRSVTRPTTFINIQGFLRDFV